MTVSEALRARIAAAGPIPFERFMEISLYGDGGFFASGPLRSAATGDFLTSPEVSPWFGRAIGRFLAQRLASLAEPDVVEVGGGSGSLLANLLPELDAADVWAVEASPVARRSLADLVAAHQIVADLEQLPVPVTGAVVANELVDNLPVALAVRRGTGWREHWVDTAGEGFGFVEVAARNEVTDWAEQFGGRVPDGGIVEVQLAATRWLEQVLRSLAQGVVIIIDYGGTVEELEPRRQQGTLRTYRGHHLGPDPLLEPGTTDITVDVNFTALLAAAAARGLAPVLARQDDFLTEWGLRDEISAMRRRELELARAGQTMEQLAVKNDRIAAETLLHPRGLGDFRVLIIEK